MHEDFRRPEKVKTASDRSFGRTLTAVFLLIGLLPLLHEPHLPRWWAIAVAMAFMILAQWWTAPLAPLNKGWTRFGLLLHHIMTPIVLGLLFFLAVFPVGWLMRAFGKDPLRLRVDRANASYWIVREHPGPSPESMKQQF